jgi:hypothetical protein
MGIRRLPIGGAHRPDIGDNAGARPGKPRSASPNRAQSRGRQSHANESRQLRTPVGHCFDLERDARLSI